MVGVRLAAIVLYGRLNARLNMKFMAVVFFLGSVTGAAAQYGVSNARDGNGNLIRDRGVNSPRTFDQPPVNNLNNINNFVNRNAPAATPSRGVARGVSR
jgi:hypothetical protein